MVKNSKKRKSGVESLPSKKIKSDVPIISQGHGDNLIGGLLFPDELDITTDTLITLAQNPTLISHKQLKPFRTAVHDYWRISQEVALTGSSLTSRISSALVDHRHVDALVLLSEMQIRRQIPKLGALQRWVRECDGVLTPEMDKEEQDMVWAVLDAILRTTQPDFIARLTGGESGQGKVQNGSRLIWYPPFHTPRHATRASDKTPDPKVTSVSENAQTALKPLQITPGPERRPPNKHPAIVWHSPEGTFPLEPDPQVRPEPQRYDVQGVPGAFVITDVFDKCECESLVSAAEKVGLEPDEPISASALSLSSLLAHNFIWLADPTFLSILFARVKPHLPPVIQGGQVKGINARFRLYRYRKGALYRPHIDGAWPSSSSTVVDGQPTYVYDSDPTLYSRLTFLIYLNDNFDGGCTTFFLPSFQSLQSVSTGVSGGGMIEARPVKPLQGAVCVFPHGSAQGSLLHEGSGVDGDGAKYVIRTEVLYEVDRNERE
ncbi:hypothetical protein SISSUDRAFT_1069674 [Sistotremastrum suecicum HHB10207 ss-3]|uniref:Fe2OG dioxygenase domain-containing protein n=1 Tax=Sistotremastrum suecicum HHB10207 ss-3 TaxID=1314776 RepID=A0A166GRX3_9AGAM|nr:hypothetical protein SISSUDRAFT_1069674 [Sistotremastrum suecicum HHB10207 ss-3]